MEHLEPKRIAKDLRDKLGLGKSYASQLANRRKMPSLTLAVRIEAALGIDPSFWVKELAAGAAVKPPPPEFTK